MYGVRALREHEESSEKGAKCLLWKMQWRSLLLVNEHTAPRAHAGGLSVFIHLLLEAVRDERYLAREKNLLSY